MPIDIPAVACDVTLILPDREMLPGRVDVSTQDGLEVAMLVAPRTPIFELERATLFLEYVRSEGVCRVTGALKALHRAPRHTDQEHVFDVVRFTAAGSPQLLQRREFIRTHHVATVNVTLDRRGAVAVECRTINVSGDGLSVRGFEGARVGDALHFQLASPEPDGVPIHGRCDVVRVTPDGDLGMRFTHIDETDRDRLVKLAYQRELAVRMRELRR